MMDSFVLMIRCAAMMLFVEASWDTFYKHEDTAFNLDVSAVEDQAGVLPCGHPNSSHRHLLLLLWYREGRGTPIYSYDTRLEGEKRHWRDIETVGGRARLRVGSKGAPPSLLIHKVKYNDQGVYRCRVDYLYTPSINYRVKLDVIVPPQTPMIFDTHGEIQGRYAGPYQEGNRMHFTCVVRGGVPTPTISWYIGSRLAEGNIFNLTAHLSLSLTRKHLHKSVVCQAKNNNLTAPVSRTVILDLYLPPKVVKIKGKKESLSARKTYWVTCDVHGSRPAALIQWFLGDHKLQSEKHENPSNGSLVRLQNFNEGSTKSLLRFIPTREADRQTLVCRAENQKLPDHGYVQDTWLLQVLYPPSLHLSLGRTLDPNNIREGDDVYFECSVRANPPVWNIQWIHENHPVQARNSERTLLSNMSLVLQRIEKNRSGKYQCLAKNSEGQSVSNIVHLRIQYAPTCAPSQRLQYGASVRKTVAVLCELQSDPPVRVFHWSFRNSTSQPRPVYKHAVETRKNSSRSVYQHKISSEQDMGELLCWGSNNAGHQTTPCVFQIIQAAPPKTPTNCTLNVSNTDIEINCLPGFNGGLDQTFLLEIYKATKKTETFNQAAPDFYLKKNDHLSGATLKVYGVNVKGRSEPFQLDLPEPPVVGERAAPSRASVILILLIAACVLSVLTVALLLIIKLREYFYKRRRRRKKNVEEVGMKQTVSTSEMEKSPDLIANADCPERKNVVVFCTADGGGTSSDLLDSSSESSSNKS